MEASAEMLNQLYGLALYLVVASNIAHSSLNAAMPSEAGDYVGRDAL